jgi:hypothetical protein
MMARIDTLYILPCLTDLFNLGMGFGDNLELIGNHVILGFLKLAESAAQEGENSLPHYLTQTKPLNH